MDHHKALANGQIAVLVVAVAMIGAGASKGATSHKPAQERHQLVVHFDVRQTPPPAGFMHIAIEPGGTGGTIVAARPGYYPVPPAGPVDPRPTVARWLG